MAASQHPISRYFKGPSLHSVSDSIDGRGYPVFKLSLISTSSPLCILFPGSSTQMHFPLSLSKQTTNWGFICLTLLLSFKNSKVCFRSNSLPLPPKQFYAARYLSAISYATCASFKSARQAEGIPVASCRLHLSLSLISSRTPFSLSCFSSSCLPVSLKSSLRCSLLCFHSSPPNKLLALILLHVASLFRAIPGRARQR